MGSLPLCKLPVFDLSLKNRDSSWVTKCDEVTRALEEYGCFIAVYDGVSQELHDAFAVATQDLYELPVDQKALNTLGPSGLCYMGYLPAFPLFEGLRMENATSEEGAEKFTKLMWSSGNQNFRESCLMFSKALAELEEITMRMVAKSYGIEKDYELLLRSTTHVLKFNKCRVPRDNENNVAVIPHTDKCFMSVIRHQTEGKGLEIQTKDGEWIEVDLSHSSFVVMAGDICTAWSNGRIEAPSHQVLVHGTEPIFSHVTSSIIEDIKIQVPQELVDEDHPLKFKPFYHHEYVKHHSIKNTADGIGPTIKSYCGV